MSYLAAMEAARLQEIQSRSQKQEAKPPAQQKPEASAAGVHQAISKGGASDDSNDATITTPGVTGAAASQGAKKRKASSPAPGDADALLYCDFCEFFFDLTSGDNAVHSLLFDKVCRAGREKVANAAKILSVISAAELAATSAEDEHYVPDSALKARFAFFNGKLSPQQMGELCKLLGVDPSGKNSPAAPATAGGDAVAA